MKKHSSKILNFAQKLGSREAGFIFACLGVLSQTIHTWFITIQLSSLTGFLQVIQAGIMSLFLNGALLYFTLKGTEQEDQKKAKRYRNLVLSFASLEVGINLYYWAYKFMIEPWPEINWGRMIIAIPFAIVLPIVLASYSYEVRVDDYSDNDDSNEQNGPDHAKIDKEEIDKLINEAILNTKQESEQYIAKINEEHSKFVQELKKEMVPTNEALLVKGLLSDQERVDLEFEWTDKQTGEIQQRVLPNVKLKKIEDNSNNISKEDVVEEFQFTALATQTTPTTTKIGKILDVFSDGSKLIQMDDKVYKILSDGTSVEIPKTDYPNAFIEKTENGISLHKEEISPEDKQLLDTL